MFFKLNDISIDLFHLGGEYKPSGREERGKRDTHTVNAIPSSLLSPSTKVIVWVPSACANSTKLSGVICRRAQSVQHGNLFLGARFGTCWFAGGDSLFPLIHVPRPGKPVLKDLHIGDKSICKDVPVSMNDCTGFEIVFSLNDRAAALAVVEDQYSKKIALVEAHMTHRWCSVRAQRKSLFESLDLARETLLELVANIFDALESMEQ
jgi:hypothetical protein